MAAVNIPLNHGDTHVNAPVSALCAFLRAQGQDVVLADEIRLHQLVERLSPTGLDTPTQWAKSLVPLLARGEEHQMSLEAHIGHWLRSQFPADQRPRIRDDDAQPDKPASQRNRIRTILIGLAFLAVSVMAALAYFFLATGEEVIEGVQNLQNPEIETGIETPIGPIDIPEPNPFSIREYAYFMVMVSLPFFMAAIAFSFYLTRPGWLGRTATPSSEADALDIPFSETAVFAGMVAKQAFQSLSASKPVPSKRLDALGSIRKTARAGGFPLIAFKGRLERREYLVIVEKTGASDHIDLIVDPLIEELRALSAQVTVYEATGHIAHLRHASGTRGQGSVARLSDITEDYRGARLILIGTGKSLWNRHTGQLTDASGFATSTNPDIAFPALELPCLLSVTPRARWGELERRLQAVGIEVFEANGEGLRAAASRDDGQGKPHLPARISQTSDAFLNYLDRDEARLMAETPLPPEEVENLVWRLNQYMGSQNARRMLLALAVVGRNFPRLTRFSAKYALRLTPDGPPDGILPEDVAQKLARLPWMRRGWVPSWLSHGLIGAADPDTLRAIELDMADMIVALDSGETPEQAPRIDRSSALSIQVDTAVAQELARNWNLPMQRSATQSLVERGIRGWGLSRSHLRGSGKHKFINPIALLIVTALTLAGFYVAFNIADSSRNELEYLQPLRNLFGTFLMPFFGLFVLFLNGVTAHDVAFPKPKHWAPWWRLDRKIRNLINLRNARRANRSGLRPDDILAALPTDPAATTAMRIPWLVYLLSLSGCSIFLLTEEVVGPDDYGAIMSLAALAYGLLTAWALHPRKTYLLRTTQLDQLTKPGPDIPMIASAALFISFLAISTGIISEPEELLRIALIGHVFVFVATLYVLDKSSSVFHNLSFARKAVPTLAVLSLFLNLGVFGIVFLYAVLANLPFDGIILSIALFGAFAYTYAVTTCAASGKRFGGLPSLRAEVIGVAGIPLLTSALVGPFILQLLSFSLDQSDFPVWALFLISGGVYIFLQGWRSIGLQAAHWLDYRFPNSHLEIDGIRAAQSIVQSMPEPKTQTAA